MEADFEIKRMRKRIFFSLKFDLEKIWKRFIYKAFSIYIQIVFDLYINGFL